MTTLLQIKPYILNFIADNLDSAFNNKIYWIGERVNVPSYPYCLLSVIAENKDKRTSHHQGELNVISLNNSGEYTIKREAITTRYKTCTITIGIYNAFVQDVYNDEDMDVAKEFAYAQIDLLEGAFEDYPINNMFSIQNISPIRPLHETVDGGYMYRYEFDLTIGYNEANNKNKPLGAGVDVDLVDTNEANTSIVGDEVIVDGDDYIETEFQVTIDNNDNIVVEIK